MPTEIRRTPTSYKKIRGGLVGEATGQGEGMSWRWRWAVICCCFCLLWIGVAFGLVAFVTSQNNKSELKSLNLCVEAEPVEVVAEDGKITRCSPNGVGHTKLTVEDEKVCLDIVLDGISYEGLTVQICGPEDVSNSRTAEVFVPEDGTSSFDTDPTESEGSSIRIQSCQKVNEFRVKALKYHPQNFYLDVRNAECSEGALRAQLGSSCS